MCLGIIHAAICDADLSLIELVMVAGFSWNCVVVRSNPGLYNIFLGTNCNFGVGILFLLAHPNLTQPQTSKTNSVLERYACLNSAVSIAF